MRQLLTWKRILFYRENTNSCQVCLGNVQQDKVNMLSFLLDSGNVLQHMINNLSFRLHPGSVLQDMVHILSVLFYSGSVLQDIWRKMIYCYNSLSSEDNSYIQGHLKIICSQKLLSPVQVSLNCEKSKTWQRTCVACVLCWHGRKKFSIHTTVRAPHVSSNFVGTLIHNGRRYYN